MSYPKLVKINTLLIGATAELRQKNSFKAKRNHLFSFKKFYTLGQANICPLIISKKLWNLE